MSKYGGKFTILTAALGMAFYSCANQGQHLDTTAPSLSTLAACGSGTVTPIGSVQGSSVKSPLEGKLVTIEGIVTAKYPVSPGLSGFYVQDAGDGNAATSDGVFVYLKTTSALWMKTFNVQDKVRVTGTVKEYANLGQVVTELDGVTELEMCASGLSLPAAAAVTFPTNLEAYEGMRVKFDQTFAVTDNYDLSRYGDLTLSLDTFFKDYTQINRPDKTGYAAYEASLPQKRLTLDDALQTENPVPTPFLSKAGPDGTRRVGDELTNFEGIVREGNSNRVLPTSTLSFVEKNPRTDKPNVPDAWIKIASFNVQNFFNGDGMGGGFPTARGAQTAAEFKRQKDKTVSAISAMDADVIGLMELENDGDGPNSAIAELVNALNDKMGAGTYDYVRDPISGVGTDAIKVGIIYKSRKITPAKLSTSSTDPVFDRLPVAVTFRAVKFRPWHWTTATFSVVVNHFKSKNPEPSAATGFCTVAKAGGNEDQKDGQSCWNDKRTKQAEALKTFMDQLALESGDSDVIALGDFNAFAKEDPIQKMTTAPSALVDLTARIPAEDRYSHAFNGQVGSFDYGFATPSLSAQLAGVNYWHIDSPELSSFDYSTPPYKKDDRYAPTPYRSSDHDPLIMSFNLKFDRGFEPALEDPMSGK